MRPLPKDAPILSDKYKCHNPVKVGLHFSDAFVIGKRDAAHTSDIFGARIRASW